MGNRRRYVKRADQTVAAVQLALETAGFTYRKWGSTQTCKSGDWIVDNDGDVYSVDQGSFDHSYRKVGVGTYLKIAPVWVELAEAAGSVTTREGITHYLTGDYLVFGDEKGGDPYAVPAVQFERMYERAE